jgi:hypothetical protein
MTAYSASGPQILTIRSLPNNRTIGIMIHVAPDTTGSSIAAKATSSTQVLRLLASMRL